MLDPEELAAFKAAVADATPLAAANRVQLPQRKPRRVIPPRPAHAAEKPPENSREKRRRDDDLPSHWQQAETPRRIARNPDEAAFLQAMAGVEPLPPPNRVHLGGPPPPPRPQQLLQDERAALHESLHGRIGLQDRLEGGDEPHYLRFGLAISVLRDLRRGRWVVQAEIDLHGLNRDEARQQLALFLAECLHHGHRCVRVVHGKGLRSPQKLSILRQLVRGWLAQRIEVLAYCQAKPQDGGEGALIVLLHSRKTQRAA